MPGSIPNVLSQHAEEAAFLWLLRDRAIRAPHYRLPDLVELDGRVDAHLEGLRIAGDEGWAVCKENLAQREPGEVFAAAVLAFWSGDPRRIEEALAVATTRPGLARAVVSALGWLAPDRVREHLLPLLDGPPMWRRIGLAAHAVHRIHPGDRLSRALADEDPAVQARALRAIGELGDTQQGKALARSRSAADPEMRLWAAWSAVLLGDPTAISSLAELVHAHYRRSGRALELALRAMPSAAARSLLAELAARPESRRSSVIGAGIVGDPVAVPRLIDCMATPELARVAAESFVAITGVDLQDERLEGGCPDGFSAGPSEAPGDDNVEMDPDEDLPWPEPKRVATWWERNGSAFEPGRRYHAGRSIDDASLREMLAAGTQRQRAGAAIELALRQPGRPLFEVRARGRLQKQLLT